MQTSQFSTKKSNWLLLTIVAFSLVIFSSCKGGKNSKNPTCVKLTKEQIQKWVKGGYTDTTNPNYMQSVKFTTAYAGPGTVFKVYVIGIRSNGDSIPETLTELTPVDTDNCNIKLPDDILTGTVPASLSDLKILKPNGQINDSLEYLKLLPFSWHDPITVLDFVAYKNFNIMKGGIIRNILDTSGINMELLPCPPCINCKPTLCPRICGGKCGPE